MSQPTQAGRRLSEAVPGERVSEAYSWADEDQQQRFQQYEGQEQGEAPQLAEGEVQRETAGVQERQNKIELDEQQLANALLETLQKLTRPQPTLATIGPPPPPPPPPSESYFARTPSTLVAPRTPRTPTVAPNRQTMRYMPSAASNGFKSSPRSFAQPENLTYVAYTRPHTRTYSEKSFATR